jgi:predicted  nucleic acid-binding Zn-ribbon protein
MAGDNGWSEYSKLVLKELETLSRGIAGLNEEIQALKSDITELRSREDKVEELRAWKQRVDEVSSPSQMKAWIREVEKLKTFKTKAVTVFLVVQGFMMCALTLSNFFN